MADTSNGTERAAAGGEQWGWAVSSWWWRYWDQEEGVASSEQMRSRSAKRSPPEGSSVWHSVSPFSPPVLPAPASLFCTSLPPRRTGKSTQRPLICPVRWKTRTNSRMFCMTKFCSVMPSASPCGCEGVGIDLESTFERTHAVSGRIGAHRSVSQRCRGCFEVQVICRRGAGVLLPASPVGGRGWRGGGAGTVGGAPCGRVPGR